MKTRGYRLYFIGMAGQWASMNMETVTRSLLIYRLTGSAALLGVMSLAQAIPLLLLSLLGGVLADRLSKKKILIAGMLGLAIVALGVGLALTLGYLSADRPGSWWILILSATLQGTLLGLLMPSRAAIISELVSHDQVMNAVALNSLGINTLRFIAPSVAGFLIDVVNFAAVYYIVVALYLLGIIFLVMIPPPTARAVIRASGALTDMQDGFSYIRRETNILYILVFTLFAFVLSQPYQSLLPVFTEDILKVGATGLGILMSVSGIGAMFGSIVIASMPNKKRGVILLFSSLVLGIALAVFAFSRSWYLSLVLIAFVGLGTTGRQSLGSTLLQSYTRSEYLGRVLSIYMMEFGMMSLGTFVAGVLAEAIGVEWALGGFALVLITISVLALVLVPRLRKLD